jgi:hypothetical protein
MKLDNATVNLILNATNLGCILGIDGLILDENAIRGYNDDQGVMVLARGPYDFEFKNIGISRLPSLKQKMKLISESEVEVEAVPRKSNPDVIEKLKFDCGRINFEFRCALAKAIKDVPSLKINKTPVFQFELTEDDYTLMTKSASAMRSKNMTIQSSDNGVRLRFSDDTGDILNCDVQTTLDSSGDIEDMSLTINLKKMLPIFRLAIQSGKFTLNILKSNIVYIEIGDMEIYVMPEV